MGNLPKGQWQVDFQDATWDKNGDVVINVMVTLPQKTITKAEAIAVGEFIARAPYPERKC